MLRLFGVLVTIALAITTAVVTWPQFFRLENTFPFAQLVAVRGPVAVGFATLTLLALLLSMAKPIRGFAASVALICFIGAGANAGIMLVRGVGTESLPEATANSLRVMTWNTAGEATPAATIAQTAVAMGADVIALPETSEEVGERVAEEMSALGSPMWVHHVAYNDEIAYGPQAWETTLLISPELGDYSVIASSEDGSSNTGTVPSLVAMPVTGDGPILVAVHAVAPRLDDMAAWQHDLQWVADQCSTDNVILLGDFNATVDHMSGYGTDGGLMGQCTDAATATGNGSIGTWPTNYPALAGAPIDHVMASSKWVATGSVVLKSLDDSGSDHRPLIVQLERASDVSP